MKSILALARRATLLLAVPLILYGCAGANDIRPGEGAAGVRLGDGRAAVEKVLGAPASVNSSGVMGKDRKETQYLVYPAKGIDVFLENGTVRSIFLYAEGAEDHRKFPGTGPSGMSLDWTRDQVLSSLGEPEARGLGLDRDLWFRYDSGIEFAFRSDGVIQHVVVTASR